MRGLRTQRRQKGKDMDKEMDKDEESVNSMCVHYCIEIPVYGLDIRIEMNKTVFMRRCLSIGITFQSN